MDGRDVILYLDVLFKHDWEKIYNCVKNKDLSMFDDEYTKLCVELKIYSLLARGYKIVVILDEEYPDWIRRNVPRPPFVIYYKGNCETILERFKKVYYHAEDGCFLK